MAVRDALNRNPKTTAAIVAVALIVLIGGLVMSRSAENPVIGPSSGPKSWYTIDDGRNFFADAANRVVPFDHQGKQAYRCYVWTCDGGKTRFVSHLERFSASARQQLSGRTQFDPLELVPRSWEVKPPLTGDSGWVAIESPQAEQIQTPRCPDGKGDTPQFVQAE